MDELTDIEQVRRRPSMYIGDTGYFGKIQYLVASVNFFLFREAKRIRVDLCDDGIEVRSDIALVPELFEVDGKSPLEQFEGTAHHGYDGPLLNALSESLTLTTATAAGGRRLTFECGKRTTQLLPCDLPGGFEGSGIKFRPDDTLFQRADVSQYNFVSFFRRLSYLHPTVRFELASEGDVTEFCSPGGIRELFDIVATPYQVLHQPIHFAYADDQVRVEAVWAYHSWRHDHGFSFINNGRAAEGGTHEDGREQAFKTLVDRFDAPIDSEGCRTNGVLYVMSIYYPEAVWSGCIKEKITNPGLAPLVEQILVNESTGWLKNHPQVAAQIKQMRPFNFPDIWFHK